ncbi:MAG TPA: Holliday junction resolvase RuvX [bacterium]|nr:Holliday junction resolvase RuvX [bacterium]
MGRVIGLDIGAAWIGVAVGDEDLGVATPRPELRVKSPEDALQQVAKLALEERAAALVVGLPLTLRGEMGPQAIVVQHFASQLREATGLPVHLFDERLTSKGAQAALAEERPRDQRRKGPSRAKPSRDDSPAAALILQGWFDRGKPRE